MAMADVTFKERQNEEIEVLQAVFMEDFKDLRQKDAWKVYRPPEICLSLEPLHSTNGGEVYTKIDMLIKCPAKYPDIIPEIKLENPKGLSNQQIGVLREELIAKAKESVGEVMIYDLAQHVQNFLHVHNKPGPKSFFEEMMSNQKDKEEKVMREKQKKVEFQKKKEEKERQQIEDEIQKRRDALKEEARKMKEARMAEKETPPIMVPPRKNSDPKQRSSVSPPRRIRRDSDSYSKGDRKRGTSTPPRDRSNSTDAGDHCKEHTGTSLISFKMKTDCTVYRGKCLGHSPRGSTMYAGMDTETGEVVVVEEWVLQWRHVGKKLGADDREECEKEAAKYLKHVNNIEQEILSLVKLNHKNLVHYISMKYMHDKGRIFVYVLKEFAGGGNLEMHTKKHVPVPYDLLRYYTTEVLEALTYLHNKAVTHKDLRASCVFLDKDGAVKLADYSLEKRLADLYEMVELTRPGVHFSDVENRPPTLGRSAKKADIYQLGVMLLSLALGQPVTKSLPEVPTNLPPELQDFITKCLIKDEKTRWSTFQLQEHEFVKQSPSNIAMNARKLQAAQDFLQKEGPKDQDVDQTQDMPLFLRGDSSGQSRLTSEFEVLEFLGKGGFGDVIKVRNQLDGRFYAIKRILLNPKSKQFNRKITREVKLLSRLNHENVVRYYNSWIETSMEPVPEDSCMSSSSPAECGPSPSQRSASSKKNSLGFMDNIEKFAPSLADASVEWSVSVDVPPGGTEFNSSESEDDEDDDEESDFGVFGGAAFLNSDIASESSEGIIFESSNTSSPIEESQQVTAEKKAANKSSEEQPTKAQFLYIQMEFCEKSTLRNCIDAGLYMDLDRVWRLFREIIEGLMHIHEQGMIHRDLKPVNIFLDSNDHVKIGDFGLATTDIIAKQQTSTIMDATLSLSQMEISAGSSKSGSMTDGDIAMTGKVGTALYVSPEVMKSTTSKMHYDQKVDIYSLGIIFFEMCYRPLSTGMERVKTLSNLRQPSVDLPEDFDEIDMPHQAAIIRWVLQHDPVKRPTSQELLQSDYLPPPQMEEAELNEVLRSTISNPQSKAYKRMIGAMFSQPVSAADDYMFDVDIHKGSFSTRGHLVFNYVCDRMEKIFQKHGAIKVTTPTLMPRNTLYEQNDQYVCFMNKSGGLVSLPYDLRAPFGRYLARNNVSSVKRYCIDRVYREKKLYGLHPRELTEATIDIVTPNQGNLVPDAEVLHIIHEIINEFPSMKDRNYFLRVNHTALIRAILMHSGIPDELHNDVITIINETKTVKHKKQEMYNRLTNVGVSDESVESLFHYIETDGPFGKVSSMLRSITKTKGQAGSLAKKGLHELEAVLLNAEHLGVKIPAILTLGLMYNIQQFSGIVFQVVVEVMKKRKAILDIVAAGGRYDGLINRFKMPRDLVSQTAVGASIAVDKIMAASVDVQDRIDMEIPPVSDVLICTLGHRAMVKEQLHLAGDLWAAGINTQVLYDTTKSLEEMQEMCRSKGISHLVVFKDTESGVVKVQSFDRDNNRITEKKMSPQEVTEGLQRMHLAKIEENLPQLCRTASLSAQGQTENQPPTSSHTGLPNLSITFLMPDTNKLASNTKKKYESQIYAKVTTAMKQLSSKVKVYVIGVELTGSVLKTIASCLDLDGDEAAYDSSIGEIVEKHQRFRKYFTKIFDKIHSYKFEDVSSSGNSNVIILYGLKDDSYKVLL